MVLSGKRSWWGRGHYAGCGIFVASYNSISEVIYCNIDIYYGAARGDWLS